MVHGFTKRGISPYRLTHKAARAVKARHKMFRIFASMTAVIISVSFMSNTVGAIETTKASALMIEEIQSVDTLSFTKKSPHEAQNGSTADPCLPLLGARQISPNLPHDASAMGFNNRRPVGKTATPVALGLVLGIRIALGPKEVQKRSSRVQIGPEIRTNNIGDNNYALSVAAYRGCKNKHTLDLLKNKNKQSRS